MKKIFAVSIIMAAAVAVSNAQVNWDVRVGANVSQFSEGDAGLKLGLKAGVAMEYAFSDLFVLRPGLFFSMKGSSDDTKFAAGFPKDFNLSYIELPVLASFRFPVSGNFSLALNAGPYVACRINGKPDALPDSEAIDFGAEAGLDFVFGRFVFGPQVQYGLNKVAKVAGESYHNINYSLTFGMKF